MKCGDYQPSGLDLHGEPTTTGNRCTLPAYHAPENGHRMELPDGDYVGWSTD